MSIVNGTYELLFIVSPALSDEEQREVIEKFTNLISANGTINEVNEWGKRRLAYPIEDLNDGFYVLVNFTAPTTFIAELERIFNITEGIMRSLVIRKDAA